MRKLPIYLALLVALSVVVELLWHTPLHRGGEAAPLTTEVRAVDSITGATPDGLILTRLDETGADVGTVIRPHSGVASVPVATPRLVRLSAPGYLPRVVALSRSQEAGAAPVQTVPLTPAADDSVSLRIAGRVMTGGGYFVPGFVGGSSAVLHSSGDGPGHAALLSAVAPMLADADLTLVTLGAPLVAKPYLGGPRPAGFHHGRATIYSASPEVAGALADAGVDVVNLADSHLYDALEGGIGSTIDALDGAGLAHFGAGANVEAAWAPAYVEANGQRVAMLGCTAFGGANYRVHFVAGPTQGGAARCTAADLRQRIASAAAQADAVVVVIDAGPSGELTTKVQRQALSQYKSLATVAATAGATLVTGAHSPLMQPVTSVAGVPWVRAPGDLLGDSRLWSTLPSSLVRVVMSGGEVDSVSADPLARVRLRPVPSAGSLADGAVRQLTAPGGSLLAAGAGTAYWPALGSTELSTVRGTPDQIVTLPGGAWLSGGAPAAIGHDLLWGTGSMEDLETDAASTGSTLWALGKYVTTSMESGCHDVQGLRLRRGPLSDKDVVISPAYRAPVTPGEHLTLLANVRLASEGASLEVRWYRSFDPAKRSSGEQSVAIPARRLGDTCVPVRLDLTVPDGMIAAEPYIRLSPRHDVNLAAELRVDDVRLIAWSDLGASHLIDTVQLPATGTVDVASDGVPAAP